MPRLFRRSQSVEVKHVRCRGGNGELGKRERGKGGFAMILSLCITRKPSWRGHLGNPAPAASDRSRVHERVSGCRIQPNQQLDVGSGEHDSTRPERLSRASKREDRPSEGMQHQAPERRARERLDWQRNRIAWSQRSDRGIPSPETLRHRCVRGTSGLRIGNGCPAKVGFPHRQRDARRCDDTEGEERRDGEKEGNPAPIHCRPRSATATATLSECTESRRDTPTPPARSVSPSRLKTTIATSMSAGAALPWRSR